MDHRGVFIPSNEPTFLSSYKNANKELWKLSNCLASFLTRGNYLAAQYLITAERTVGCRMHAFPLTRNERDFFPRYMTLLFCWFILL